MLAILKDSRPAERLFTRRYRYCCLLVFPIGEDTHESAHRVCLFANLGRMFIERGEKDAFYNMWHVSLKNVRVRLGERESHCDTVKWRGRRVNASIVDDFDIEVHVGLCAAVEMLQFAQTTFSIRFPKLGLHASPGMLDLCDALQKVWAQSFTTATDNGKDVKEVESNDDAIIADRIECNVSIDSF